MKDVRKSQVSFRIIQLLVLFIQIDKTNQEFTECKLESFPGCQCLEMTLKQDVFCHNQQFAAIPSNISTSLANLKITGDRIPILVDVIPYRDLKGLHLEQNQIRFISDSIFRNLKNLATLSLAENEISGLSSETFDGLVSLEILVLTGNKLYEISADVFTGITLPSLQTLKLDRCSIYSIQPNSFSGLAQLTSLNVAFNRIESLSTIAEESAQLYNLTHFNVSNNRLDKIDTDFFTYLPTLTHLYLDDNLLTELDNRTFRDSLTFLSIRGNRISSIGVNSLYKLSRLQTLDLSNNRLTHLNASELPWETLESFLIHDNPWDCNGCANSWLVDEDIVKLWNSESSVSCATPSEMSGTPVYTLESEGLIFTQCNSSGSSPVLVGLLASGIVLILVVILLVGYYLRRQKRSPFKSTTNGEMTSLSYSKMAPPSPFAIGDDDDDEHEEL